MIGNTPLILIDERRKIYAKMETHNLTGSVKDRMIKYICDVEVNRGRIVPGKTTLVEATSGNTGIALSAYAASIGCKCKIIMPENMSEQRKDMMRAFGSEIIETGFNAFIDAIKIRDELIFNNNGEFKEGFFSPLQFQNNLNIECHMAVTAPEIHSQLSNMSSGTWSAFVHGSGTGGTMMGVKKYLLKSGLKTKCILVEPYEDNASHGIQGINDGKDFLLEKNNMDNIIKVKTEDAISKMKKMWSEKGLLVGISSGANVLAAERYVDEFSPEGYVITMLCDRGERYL